MRRFKAILAAGAIVGLCIYIERLGAETRKTSDAMSELMAKNDTARELDMQRAERLKQLSEKQGLTNAEYIEGGNLMKDLEGKYGSFGAVLDTVSKKIDFAAKAQANLNEKMAAAKIAYIDAAISEKKKNIEIAKGYNDTMSSYWYRANRPWDEIASFWGGGTAGRIQQNGEYISGKGGQLDQIGSLQKDRRKWEGFLKTGKLPSQKGSENVSVFTDADAAKLKEYEAGITLLEQKKVSVFSDANAAKLKEYEAKVAALKEKKVSVFTDTDAAKLKEYQEQGIHIVSHIWLS